MANRYTYDDFQKAMQSSGLGGQFSDADLKLAQQNPDAGMSILKYKQDYKNAATDEARALANLGAEGIDEAAEDGAVAGAGDDEAEARAGGGVGARGSEGRGGEGGVVVEDAFAVEDGEGVDEGAPEDARGDAAPTVAKVGNADGGFGHAVAATEGHNEELEVEGEGFNEHPLGGVAEDFGADELHPTLGVTDREVEGAAGEGVVAGAEEAAAEGIVDLGARVAFAADDDIRAGAFGLGEEVREHRRIEVEVTIEEEDPVARDLREAGEEGGTFAAVLGEEDGMAGGVLFGEGAQGLGRAVGGAVIDGDEAEV